MIIAQSGNYSFTNHNGIATQKDTLEFQITALNNRITKKDLSLSQTLELIDTLTHIYKEVKDSSNYNYTLYELKGRTYAAHKQYIEALKYYQKYMPHCKKESLHDVYFFIDIGNVYFHLNYLQLAQRYYREAEAIALDINNKPSLSTIYLNYSLIEREAQNTQKAFFYLDKKLKNDKTLDNKLFHLPHTYNALGRLHYSNSKDYNSAIKYFNLAENMLTTSVNNGDYYYNSTLLLAEVYVFKGLALLKLKKKGGHSFLDKGLSILEDKKDNKRMMAYLNYYIAKHYKETCNYKKSKQLFQGAALEFFKNKNYIFLKKIYTELFEVHHYDGTKINFWEKYNAIQDTIIKQNEQLLFLNENILLQEKQKTINQQKEVIKIGEKNRYYLSLLISLIITILCLTLIFYVSIWKKNNLIKEYVAELENANNFKELILSIIGHDLRTPLGVLVTNSNYILKAAYDKNLNKVIGMTHHMSKTAQNVYLTMEQLMQWAILKKSKNKQHEIEMINLNPFVQKIITKLDSIITLSQITIHNNIPLNCTTSSDKNLMEIIIRNLLMNAIKHSSPKQSITISASLDKSYIKIKDEGQGFSTKILENIFNKKVPISIIQQGGGLGFEIIKELCSILKIDLNVYNQEGAVVELLIPIKLNHKIVPTYKHYDYQKEMIQKISESDIKFLIPYVRKLKKSKLYQGSVIMKIILEIEQHSNHSTSIKEWIQELKNAIDAFDEDAYFNVLSLILKSKNYVG